ncbi:MAG: hypothetical protein ACI959_000997 [Limisphaerales bacterium]|jgi:hypothetical protein
MERNESPLLPIKSEDIRALKEEMTQYIKSASWKPDKRKVENEKIDLGFLMQNKTLGIDQEDSTSIMKEAIRISDDRMLLTTTVAHVVNVVRDGMCIGKHVSKLYEQSSGLEQLLLRNREGRLHQSEQPEFHDKMETASAVLLFVSSYFIVWRLNEDHDDQVNAINIEFGGVPEVKLSRPSTAVNCMLYYYGAYLERSGIVNTELELVKLTILYFERMIEEVQLRKDAMNFTNFFTNNHYKLEHTEFVIQGFETSFMSHAASISFNRVEWGDIVGNKEAKHMFRRFSERLLCYDVEAKKNPMMELGGLPSVTMGDGRPGTGKSMLIAATGTFLKDMCELIGMPFLFWPLPENIISTFQGGSAERAVEWFRPMQDTNKLIFAPIDDAENNLEERTRQGVSAGVREFIGVFLRNTEGAYAVNYGNRMISLFTNIPDQIDKAVLSRIQFRAAIDGAARPDDYIDQDYLWWRKFHDVMPGFVDANDPKGYQYLSAQKELGSVSEVFKAEYEFKNEEVEAVYKSIEAKMDPTDHQFFGDFYMAVQARFPFFSSRDLRNIQKAVDARVIDFDMPDDWMGDPELFFRKDYDTKLNMLKELVKSNLGGLSFSAVRLREALNYIDTAVRINTTGIERNIKETAKQIYIQDQARERLRNGEIDMSQ